MPAPGSGESPMRPGSFPLVPPVDTATASRPSESRATAPTVSAPACRCWRLRLLMKTEGSHISIPWSRAKREAPDPEISTGRPSRRTSTARSTGCRTSFRHATPPARSSAPSITPASSSTSPSALRDAPTPAFRRGSSSMWRTAATAAASAPSSIRIQPSSRARSTAACRDERSAAGTGPAPPWTMSALAARLALSPAGGSDAALRRCAGRGRTAPGALPGRAPACAFHRSGARHWNASPLCASPRLIHWTPYHPPLWTSRVNAMAPIDGLGVECAELFVQTALGPPALQLVAGAHAGGPYGARQSRVPLAHQTEHLLGDPAIVGVPLRSRPQLAQVIDLAKIHAEVPAHPVGDGDDVLCQGRA